MSYTAYHPRWYRAPVSTFWWLRRRSYALFVARELSGVFVAWFVVFALLLCKDHVRRLSLARDAHDRGGPRLEYRPVRITNWQPQARTY